MVSRGTPVANEQVLQLLSVRLAAVEDNLRAACVRAGRTRGEVRLVAVTKTVSVEIAALLPQLGILDLGENRPQELWRKAEAIPQARWHLIGHLQRNKIERTLPLVHAIHSVDSTRLLEALDEAYRGPAPLPILLEVNASREASKQGFTVEELPRLVPILAKVKNLQVAGLMTMAAEEEDPERCRPTFQLLRDLRDSLERELGRPMPELSMGMSNDYAVAVEEGSTLVRIGTALFEGLSQ